MRVWITTSAESSSCNGCGYRGSGEIYLIALAHTSFRVCGACRKKLLQRLEKPEAKKVPGEAFKS